MKIPKLKKQMNSFLLGEDGKISKKSIISSTLIIVGASSIASAFIEHSNSFHGSEEGDVGHTNHGSHSSHGNHGNHGNHSSGCGPCPCSGGY